jgi:hypothetical protein
MLFSFTPPTRLAPAQLARLCLPLLLLLGVGCGKSRTSDEADANRAGDNAEGQATTVSGPVWRAESEAFSPSLPYLFDEGRIYVGQADQLDLPQSPIAVADYAFSAVDRHGRLYHFDNQGRWWMAPGHSLPAPLPPGGWDVAWDKANRQPELLVTAPWQGQTSMTLMRWSSGQWTTATVAAWSAPTTATAQAAPAPLHLPAARLEACRRYLPEARSWLVAGGRVTTATLPAAAATTAALALARPPAALLLERGLTHVWPPVSVTTATLAVPAVGLAPPATAPDLAQTRALLGVTTDGTVNALLHSGDLWVWQAGAWHWREKLPNMDHLLLSRGLPPHLDAKHDPVPAQLLFVWDFGRGYDQIMLRTAQWTTGEKPHQADALNQTALVKLNEEDEGFWRGWGRVVSETQRDGSSKELFTEGFKGSGEDALHIQGEVGDVYFHRSQLRIIELPPELKNLRPAAAAWVPALGGLVVPSVDGVGLAAQRSPFFPADSLTGTTSTTTTDSRNLIDVIQRTYRFWNFRGELIEWIKAPYDLHNQLGYPDSYFGENGKRRTLSWTFPQPGTFRFDFHEYTSENQQWVSSPLLTLRTLPQLAWNPTDELIICDPVVWGDPAEIILIGWCGRLTRPKAYKELKEELGGEVYTEVPTRGFMARISALNPQDWQVTNLPIAFCQGARLVVDGGSGKLWLVGGRVAAMRRDLRKDPYKVMISNTIVSEWNGKEWHSIIPQGTVPRMKVTSNVAFDTRAHQLLSLTPRSLYAFEGDTWKELWTRPKPRGEDWPDQLGLYVHPLSNLTLGIWFKGMAEMHVWAGSQWQPVAAGLGMDQVTWDSGDDSVAGGPWPNLAENLIPALANDAFISIDGEQLARLRMDVPRNRDEDRLLGAHWISLRFDEQTQLITPAPGLLGLHAEKK